MRGKAHMEVWDETEARNDFMRVLDLDPGMKKTIKKELAVLKMRMELKNEEDRLKYKGMFAKMASEQESLELENPDQEIPEQTCPEQEMENPEEAPAEEQANSMQKTPEDMTSAQSDPEQTTTAQSSSDNVIPEQSTTQDLTPEQTTIEETAPEQFNTNHTFVAQSDSEETSPSPEPMCPEQEAQDTGSSDQMTPGNSPPINES